MHSQSVPNSEKCSMNFDLQLRIYNNGRKSLSLDVTDFSLFLSRSLNIVCILHTLCHKNQTKPNKTIEPIICWFKWRRAKKNQNQQYEWHCSKLLYCMMSSDCCVWILCMECFDRTHHILSICNCPHFFLSLSLSLFLVCVITRTKFCCNVERHPFSSAFYNGVVE